MAIEFIEKLRSEIEQTQKRRHDFILKKFAFGGTLLGLGSLSVPVSDGLSITLLPLLYIVPLLAVAYDIYIVSEDYGIKRAGAFLGLCKEDTVKMERLWEAFVNEHDRSPRTIRLFYGYYYLSTGRCIAPQPVGRIMEDLSAVGGSHCTH